nr:immunoglobulin heavy chain junction region [Mus musculus]
CGSNYVDFYAMDYW